MVYIDLTNKGNIYIFTKRKFAESKDSTEEFEIYDAIIDNNIIPIQYHEPIRQYICRLLTLEDIVEYLKYIKNKDIYSHKIFFNYSP